VKTANDTQWLQNGNYLLTSINRDTGGWTGGQYWSMIIDRQGRPVWAQAAPNGHWTLFSQISVSGDYLLWNEATYWSSWQGDGEDSTVHRTYLDEEIEVIATPGLHHAFVQMPDDTLVWGSQAHGGGESLRKKGPGDSEDVEIWNCQQDWPGVNGCESNGIFYSAERDTFLYSFYTNDTMVEVAHSQEVWGEQAGESLWWAGTVHDDGERRYSFSPPDSQYSWQHGVSYTETGSLLVSTESSANCGNNCTTMVREYHVNHKERTLEEIWSYSSGVYAGTNGDAWRLDNGNTLHLVGSAGHIKEVDDNGQTVWHLDYNGSHLIGRGEFIEDLYSLVKPK